MKRILKSFVVLSTIFLSGCQSGPGELIVKQRFIHLEFYESEGKKLVDPDLSFCAVRDYKYSIHFIGPLNKFQNVALENCDKMTGNAPTDYVHIVNFQEEVRREIESHE